MSLCEYRAVDGFCIISSENEPIQGCDTTSYDVSEDMYKCNISDNDDVAKCNLFEPCEPQEYFE